MAVMESLLHEYGAANRLGISAAKVRRMAKRREIPFVDVGGEIRFVPEQLDAWVRERSVKPEQREVTTA